MREAILKAASDLFVEVGYRDFSLRKVAEQIGYSPGTLYLYFQDKDEVLFTIMSEGLVRFQQMLLEAAQTENPRDRLVNISRAYLRFGLQYPAHYQLMFLQRTDYLQRSDDGRTPQVAQIFGIWHQAIQDAMQAGVLRTGSPASTGDTLWALLHGVVSIAILMPNFDEKRAQEMIDTALEMVGSGIHGN